MAFTIAFAGKGGTGKTTLAGLTVRCLVGRGKVPVLAVDADPNYCLHEVLGVTVRATVGSMREASLETIKTGTVRPGGLSIEEIFDYQIQQCLMESKGFDLIVMGRPEGPGCYCAANNMIRKYIDRLAAAYRYIVIDNEAGMEHLSRMTTNAVDLLIIVSDPSARGIETVKRIDGLIDELRLDVRQRVVVLNRVTDADRERASAVQREHARTVGVVPFDPGIAEAERAGKSVFEIPHTNDALLALSKLLDSIDLR